MKNQYTILEDSNAVFTIINTIEQYKKWGKKKKNSDTT